ncbi:putative oxidoreductase [Triangularia verruculosa]|uniref:Oxidoreductase n=1 Tax=Triangularia verruculosa TaxID=2587418 RepID=A0AAN6XL18_9PEZI|nr:putative oxidoreductase [Triangularia verruculosa]
MAGIALLGAGIFARHEHLPAILASPELLSLKAVYSRSQTSATALADSLPSGGPKPDIYYDSPTEPGRGLADLLKRDDIVAVDVALPIVSQPEVIRQALKAGKHVLSEKPVAADVKGARELIEWYNTQLGENKPLWGVAENFRYMESLVFAGEEVKRIGGRVVTFKLEKFGWVAEDNKYFNTQWRKVPDYQGGFLLDGGVHFVAALRYLLGASGQELSKLVAYTALLEERLQPLDTIHGVASTKQGVNGSVVISFGTEFKNGTDVEIVTTNGTVSWNPTEVKTVTKEGESKKEFEYSSGVAAEVAVFAQAIKAGTEKVDGLQTPEEALRDLEVLEGLLESGSGSAKGKEVAV